MDLPGLMEFECPVKTHCGDRALNHIPFELRALGATKPLLIGDEAASRENRLAPVLKACRDAAMTLGVVEDIPTTHAEECVRQLAAIYRDKDCDAILAVGQGGFIDLAKWLNLAVSTGEESLSPFIAGKPISRGLKPLAVVPSAAADGYELSGYLHIQNQRLRSVRLMPTLLFLDPRTAGQPAHVVMVETALTAFVNGVEAFFGVDANPMKSVYASTAAMLAADALFRLAGRGGPDDRLALTVAHAAALGGCALGCDRLSTTHYLAEAIAATGKASAAQSRGILLSYVLEYRAVKNGLKVDTLLSLVNGNDRLARTPEHQRSPSAFYALRSLIDRLFETTDGKIGRTLQDIGLPRAELKTMAASAQAKGAEEDPGVLEAILSHAWEGRPVDRTT